MHKSLVGMTVTANHNYNLESDSFDTVTGIVVSVTDDCTYVMDETGRVYSCDIPGTLVHEPEEYVRRINKDNAKDDGWVSDLSGFYRGEYAVKQDKLTERWEVTIAGNNDVVWAGGLKDAMDVVDNLILEGNGAE